MAMGQIPRSTERISSFEMNPIYGDKHITKQTVYVWCKKMPDGQKFVSYNEVQPVVLQWHR